MSLLLVGYFPKVTAVPAGWSYAGGVTELCSMSTCIAAGPEGWIDRWLHIELGLFNSPEDALAVISERNTEFSLFAYRILDHRFDDGVSEPLVISAGNVTPLPDSFTSLGFDIVTKDPSSYFECSPLSCNGMAAHAPVNRYCLIDSLEIATSLAVQYSRGGGVEPGYYHVIEVLREREQRSSAGA